MATSKSKSRQSFETFFKKKNKYKNIRSKEYKGRSYDSLLECEMAMWLNSLKKEGKIKEIETQHKIEIYINKHFICNHYVDFEITLKNNKKKWVECKGFWTRLYVLKMKLVKATFKQPYLINPQEKELLK